MPYIRISLLTLSFLIAILYVFIRRQIKKIEQVILAPLESIVNKLKHDDLNQNDVLPQTAITEFNILQETLKNYSELKKTSALGEIATQLAHDIRSPLEALKTVKDDLDHLPDEARKRVQLSINRIEEIAYNLLSSRNVSQKESSHMEATELLSLAENVLTEKRLKYRNHSNLQFEDNFDSRAVALFSKINPPCFKRVLSNIINNAAEAIGENAGSIKIELSTKGDTNLVVVSDTGKGFTEESMTNLFKKGVSTKAHGNGLGLYFAKKEIEKANGSIQVCNNGDTGAKIIISLPKDESPCHIQTSINIAKVAKVIILDDDPTIHEVWKSKFDKYEMQLEHFYSSQSLLSTYKELPENSLLLSDYELVGSQLDGIECIEFLKHKNSLLVTARFEEKPVIKRCKKNDIKILPKNLIRHLKIINESQKREIVLIDDDKFVHLTWSSYFKAKGITVTSYYSINEFMATSSNISKHMNIFIDSNLGNGIKGEIESERIFNEGFKNLFISTGHRKEDIKKPMWIKDVLSKSSIEAEHLSEKISRL